MYIAKTENHSKSFMDESTRSFQPMVKQFAVSCTDLYRNDHPTGDFAEVVGMKTEAGKSCSS